MSVTDRWHKTYPREGDKPCKCGTVKRPMYPTAEHPRPAEGGKPATGGGLRWQVRWVDLDGKACKRNFRLKEGKDKARHAEAFDADIKARLDARTYIDPSAGQILLQDYGMQWRDHRPKGKPNSEKNRDGRLAYVIDMPKAEGERKSKRRTEGQVPPLSQYSMSYLAVRPSVIQSWIKWMEQFDVSSEFRGQACRLLRQIFDAAVDDGIIHRNPMHSPSIEIPKAVLEPVVPWTLEQVTAAVDCIRGLSKRDVCVPLLGAGAGMRQGEILALAVDDIDFLRRVIHIRRSTKYMRKTLVFGLPKRDKVRTVPLSDPLSLQLAAHLEQFKPVEVTLPWALPDGHPHTAKLLFVDPRGGVWPGQQFNRYRWWPARKAAGVPEIRANGMHAMRHTFASALLSHGVDIRTLSDYLGHSDPGFTLKYYAHLMPDAADRTRAALGAFFTPMIQSESALKVPSAEETAT